MPICVIVITLKRHLNTLRYACQAEFDIYTKSL